MTRDSMNVGKFDMLVRNVGSKEAREDVKEAIKKKNYAEKLWTHILQDSMWVADVAT